MVARQILTDALAGVAMTFIYDYKDDGSPYSDQYTS